MSIRHALTGADGVALTVYEDGPRDAPPIVLLHGWSQCHLSWDRQLPLAQEFRLIRPDLRGHGTSGKPDAASAYDNSAPWAGDVHAILTQLALVHPLLVGWSMGGTVVNDYLRVHGDGALSGIALIGANVTTGRFVPPDLAAARANDPDIIATGMYSDNLAVNLAATLAFVKACFHQPPTADALAQITGYNMLCPPAVRAAARGRHEDYRATAATIQVPALIQWGAHERLAPPALGRPTVKAYPTAQEIVYADSGHSPFYEEADRFNADLATFARKGAA